MVCSSARRYSPPRSASAKWVPSAEMPKPENIRRIATGPKSANRSIRKSRSMRGGSRLYEVVPPCGGATRIWRLAVNLRGRQLHRLAAAASAGLVRIIEDELRRHLVDLVVHLGTEQKQHSFGIDQDLDALVLDDLVGGADIVGVFDGIGLPGAAAVLDSDPQADDFGVGALGQFRNPQRGGFGQFHDLRAGPRLRLGCRRW